MHSTGDSWKPLVGLLLLVAADSDAWPWPEESAKQTMQQAAAAARWVVLHDNIAVEAATRRVACILQAAEGYHTC